MSPARSRRKPSSRTGWSCRGTRIPSRRSSPLAKLSSNSPKRAVVIFVWGHRNSVQCGDAQTGMISVSKSSPFKRLREREISSRPSIRERRRPTCAAMRLAIALLLAGRRLRCVHAVHRVRLQASCIPSDGRWSIVHIDDVRAMTTNFEQTRPSWSSIHLRCRVSAQTLQLAGNMRCEHQEQLPRDAHAPLIERVFLSSPAQEHCAS
jgi:hypothetical protein